MRMIEPYPHIEINVEDLTIFRPVMYEQLPLFRPLVIAPAERGIVNTVQWAQQQTDSQRMLGYKTFEKTSPYYSRESALLTQIHRYSGAFICRVASSTAKSAATVIHAHVATKNIPVYKVTGDGVRERDTLGNFIYERDPDTNDIITVEGIEIVLTNRPLIGNETLENFQSDKTTITVGSVEYTSYPIMLVHTGNNPGAWGNSMGFSLFFDAADNNYDLVQRIGAALFTIAPEERQVNGSTRAIRDVYSRQRNTFALRPNVTDEVTAQQTGMAQVMQDAYGASLPYSFKLFSNNIKAVGDVVIEQGASRVAWVFVDDPTDYAVWTDDAGYSSGDTVRNKATGEGTKYWTANADTATTDVPGVSGKWDLTVVSTYLMAAADNIAAGSYQITVDPLELDDVLEGQGVALATKIATGTKIVDINREGGVLTLDQPTLLAINSGNLYTIGETENTQILLEDPAYFEGIDSSTGLPVPNGWVVNFLSGIDPLQNQDGRSVHYQKMVVNTDEDHALITALNAAVPTFDPFAMFVPERNINTYLSGGSDGATDYMTSSSAAVPSQFELDLQNVLAGALYNPLDGEFLVLEDASRYPFNYLIDTGYTIQTKKRMLDFMNVREDVRVTLGAMVPGGSQKQISNLSTARELRNYALAQRESVLFGTGCCRASIFAQAGHIIGEDPDQWFPATYWNAVVHAAFQNKDYLDLEPAGLPNSEVTLFSEWNWIPGTEETKRRLWNTGVNYSQYFTRTRVHYPAVRSVYEHETSSLVNDTLVDALCYTKQRMRELWHRWTNVTMSYEDFTFSVKADGAAKLRHMYNNKYRFDMSVFQTADERKLGYVYRILVNLTAPNFARVFDVDIKVHRDM